MQCSSNRHPSQSNHEPARGDLFAASIGRDPAATHIAVCISADPPGHRAAGHAARTPRHRTLFFHTGRKFPLASSPLCGMEVVQCRARSARSEAALPGSTGITCVGTEQHEPARVWSSYRREDEQHEDAA